MACRHNNTWLVAGGFIEWCYVCGAIRRMTRVDGVNAVTRDSTWVRPTGDKDDNPYKRMRPLPSRKWERLTGEDS